MAKEGIIKTITDAFQSISDPKKPAKVVSDSFLPAFHFNVSFIGFKIGEKLLRPATVVVSKGPANPPPAVDATPAEEVPSAEATEK